MRRPRGRGEAGEGGRRRAGRLRGRNEGTYHEGLEVWPPKLADHVAHLPLVRASAVLLALHDAVAGLARRVGSEAEVHARLEPFLVALVRLEVVAGELEEGRADLDEEDVRVAVLVDEHDALDRAAHAVLLVVVLPAGE